MQKGKASMWMICVPPAGLSLQQHPGAAWVIDTNSSISDFVAGGEPLSISLAAAATNQWLPGCDAYSVEEVRLDWMSYFSVCPHTSRWEETEGRCCCTQISFMLYGDVDKMLHQNMKEKKKSSGPCLM